MIQLVQGVLFAYIIVIWVRIVFSWIRVSETKGIVAEIDRWSFRLTEPLLAPIRRAIPSVQVGGVGVDFSTFILLLLVYFVRALI